MPRRSTKTPKASESKPKEFTTITVPLDWLIFGAILLVFGLTLIASIITAGFHTSPFGIGLPKEDDLKKSVVDYINNDILKGNGEITVKNFDTKRVEYLKHMTLSYNGQDLEAFVSADGKKLYIFSEAYELKPSKDDGTAAGATTTAAQTDIKPTAKPKVEFYTMSFCPYGNQAEGMIKPVYDLLKGKADFIPHYVIYSDYAKTSGASWSEYCYDKDQKYCSMHGIQELRQDVRELCVYRDQQAKFWPFVDAVNQKCTYQNVDSCWEGVAKSVGVDINKVKSCYSKDAVSLLKKEVDLNKKYSVQGSPTIFINGASYSGARSPEAFKSALCTGFNSKPGDCSKTLSTATPDSSGQCN